MPAKRYNQAMQPTFSVVIPTYNCAENLERCLKALTEKGGARQGEVEYLVVDGGSTDATREVAEQYGATILENPKRLPEYAKLIGVRKAKGVFGIFNDSDEVPSLERSFEIRRRIQMAHPDIACMVLRGHRNPEGYSRWSEYLNVVGDPFSQWLYGQDGGDLIRAYRNRVRVLDEDADMVALEVVRGKPAPLLDACGYTFHLATVRKYFGDDLRDEHLVRITAELPFQVGQVAILKHVVAMHYSSSTLGGIIRKIDFRVRSNLLQVANAGHTTREKIGASPKFRTMAFPFYAVSLVAPLITGAKYALRYRNPIFLAHPYLCLVTLFLIVRGVIAKKTGRLTESQTYG